MGAIGSGAGTGTGVGIAVGIGVGAALGVGVCAEARNAVASRQLTVVSVRE
jgi:hypothetical protein